MNKFRVYWIIFFCCCLFACSKATPPNGVDLQDRPVFFSQYEGKWIVVNYWATWCQPCLTELPKLDALAAEQSGKIVVLGVNFDGLPRAEIQRFVQTQHLAHMQFLQNFSLALFGIKDINTLPTTFIFSAQGKLVATLNGPQTTKSILATIRQAGGQLP